MNLKKINDEDKMEGLWGVSPHCHSKRDEQKICQNLKTNKVIFLSYCSEKQLFF